MSNPAGDTPPHGIELQQTPGQATVAKTRILDIFSGKTPGGDDNNQIPKNIPKIPPPRES